MGAGFTEASLMQSLGVWRMLSVMALQADGQKRVSPRVSHSGLSYWLLRNVLFMGQ